MANVVNTPLYDAFDLLDTSNTPITGKTTSDFTAKAYLIKTPATTAPVTVTELDAVNLPGKYGVSFTPTAVGAWGESVVYNSGGVYRQFSGTYDVVTAQQADPAASYVAPAGTILATTAPVALDGTITLYSGSTYAASEVRSLNWSTSDAGTWPDLTGATITFAMALRDPSNMPTVTVAGSVTTATGATKSVRVELAASDTSGIRAGTYRYQVRATLTNGHVITLANGIVLLQERIGG